MELIKDCRNCKELSNCMNIFGFVIDANKCSQFEMICIKDNTALNKEEERDVRKCIEI